jgi:hypothetical protein
MIRSDENRSTGKRERLTKSLTEILHAAGSCGPTGILERLASEITADCSAGYA